MPGGQTCSGVQSGDMDEDATRPSIHQSTHCKSAQVLLCRPLVPEFAVHWFSLGCSQNVQAHILAFLSAKLKAFGDAWGSFLGARDATKNFACRLPLTLNPKLRLKSHIVSIRVLVT